MLRTGIEWRIENDVRVRGAIGKLQEVDADDVVAFLTQSSVLAHVDFDAINRGRP